MKANPDFVKMTINTRSRGSFYDIIVFSVNGEEPVIIIDRRYVLCLPVGKNVIVANYSTEAQKNANISMIGSLVGGLIGLIVILFSYKKTKKEKYIDKAVNGITMEIETVRNGRYELKANPSSDKLVIVCEDGEKHSVKKF